MSSKKISHSVDIIGNFFDKFPALPKKWKENIVKIVPYFALIIGILGILYGLDGIRQLITSSPLSYIDGTSDYIVGLIATIIYLLASIVLVMAYPPTKSKKYMGWNLLFWSEVFNLIGGILTFSSIVSLVIWALIVFYIIFQIRPYYK